METRACLGLLGQKQKKEIFCHETEGKLRILLFLLIGW